MTTRCYVSDPFWEQPEIVLNPEASHHIARVLRMGPGEALEVFDGRGRVASTELVHVAKQSVTVRVVSHQEVPVPRPRITLLQSLIKTPSMDLVIRKATELGVSVIQPVHNMHCVVRSKERPERWQKIVVSAAEQCGANWMPTVHPVCSWETALTNVSSDTPFIICSLNSKRPMRDVLRDLENPEQLILAVGPEGDYSAEEETAAQAAGALSVSLGALTLRAETATIMALSALRYEYGGI